MAQNPNPSLLDPGQITKRGFDEVNDAHRVEDQSLTSAYDPVNNAIRVEPVTGQLVPEKYDEISLTYVASGNGAGQIQTATYKLAGATVATLTLSYDAQNRLVDVTRT